MNEVKLSSNEIGRFAASVNWGVVILALMFIAANWEGAGPHSAMGNGIRYMFVSVPVLIINLISLIRLFWNSCRGRYYLYVLSPILLWISLIFLEPILSSLYKAISARIVQLLL